jgi:hypothetical protein
MFASARHLILIYHYIYVQCPEEPIQRPAHLCCGCVTCNGVRDGIDPGGMPLWEEEPTWKSFGASAYSSLGRAFLDSADVEHGG